MSVGRKMGEDMRNFTRSNSVEGNTSGAQTVVVSKSRQISLNSGIAEEEGAVKVNYNLDLYYDMSEEEDEEDPEVANLINQSDNM